MNFFSRADPGGSHDHQQFEVFCYSDVISPTTTTRQAAAATPTAGERSWARVDERGRRAGPADQIDILVDLTGHIGGGTRLLVFARKPAPIQVTYLGYQNTTGMQAMDYRLTDAYADPPGDDRRVLHRTARAAAAHVLLLSAVGLCAAVGPLPALKRMAT